VDMLTNKATVTLGGKEWHVSPLTVEDLAELQTWVYSKLDDPIKVARECAEGMPENVVKELMTIAYEDVRSGSRKLGSPDATKLLGTFDGFIEQVYLHTRKNHPDMDRLAWNKLINEQVDVELAVIVDKLKEKEGGAIPDPSIGEPTLPTSPDDTSGRPETSDN